MALSLARLADGVGNSILFVIIPLYIAQLPAPWLPLPESVLVGIAIALYGLVNSAAQPFAGAYADRASRRKPFILVGLLLMAIGTLSFVFATRFSHLLLIRALQGIGVALTIPASLALMATATEKRTRGGAMGVYTSLRMMGLAVGPLVGGFLYVHFGFDSAFYTGTILILLGLLLVHLWVHEKPAPPKPKGDARPRLFDRALLTPGIVGLAIATFVMASAFTMMVSLEKQFNERLDQTALGFGLAFSALMLSRLLFQIPLGSLSDRIGRKPVVIAGLLLLAPSTVLLGLAGTTLQLAGYRLLQGLAAAAIAAPTYALAADLTTAGGEGRQISVVTIGFGLGIALGPLLAGVLAVYFFELPFLVGGVMSLLGALVVLRYVPETVQRHQEEQKAAA
jgi:MFS family permease